MTHTGPDTAPILRALGPALIKGVRLVNRPLRQVGVPFARPELLLPHQRGRYTWTHYGVMIPSLPEPWRYFNVMILNGLSGGLILDRDDLVTTTARDTATAHASTGAPGANHFRGYALSRDCELRADGSLLDYGGDITISGTHPHRQVRVRAGDFTAELNLHCTDKVAWFARTWFYDHLSLLTEYEGEVALGGHRTPVSGLGTFEYAAAMFPGGYRREPLPARWKIPTDFFTYHVLNLPDGEQVLLANMAADGTEIISTAHVRSRSDHGWAAMDKDVAFQVTEYADQPVTGPGGRLTRWPRRFEWTVRRSGHTVLRVIGEPDTEPRHGVGQGYIGGCTATVEYQGMQHRTRGYFEYIDCRATAEARCEAGQRADQEARL
jgi:hypothetical protein